MAVITLKDHLLGNRYRLLHLVGKGGMAIVYEAYDQMLERPVAIKLLGQDFSSDPGFRNRFKQEAKAAANLSHPNIVTVHDFGIDLQGLYIVMEYVAGKDLKTRIKAGGVYSLQDGIPLILQACYALGYAHRAGIIHCDVKPQNMIVTDDNRLKITDFGIARALSTIEPEERSDIVWGSPQYLSPEQALGNAPSPASDVYSLGIILYEMFTGQLPFLANTTEELIKLHQTQFPRHPIEVNPQCSTELDQVIMKVLSKEPSSRYRTADQLGSVLTTILERSKKTPLKDIDSRPLGTSRPKLPLLISYEDYSPDHKNNHFSDWRLIGIELICLLLVGGLIPFWLFVWFSIKPLLVR
ncbi:MAG: serine/threonine-protein kinase [Chloroflexi bacterium]|nr:serine/threonine-protein kinase [Chloroflexota bacterium]